MLGSFRTWARAVAADHPEVVRIGCFGSYARGDYGPASDLDVLIEVTESPHARWFDRPLDFPMPREVPVGVELFVYTSDELERMRVDSSAWLRHVLAEMVWVSSARGGGS